MTTASLTITTKTGITFGTAEPVQGSMCKAIQKLVKVFNWGDPNKTEFSIEPNTQLLEELGRVYFALSLKDFVILMTRQLSEQDRQLYKQDTMTVPCDQPGLLHGIEEYDIISITTKDKDNVAFPSWLAHVWQLDNNGQLIDKDKLEVLKRYITLLRDGKLFFGIQLDKIAKIEVKID